MANFAGGHYGGEHVQAEPTRKRPPAGPTIRTAADWRRARDLLMKVASDAGYNRFDLEILFGVSPNHPYKRLRQLRAAYIQREQRHGL